MKSLYPYILSFSALLTTSCGNYKCDENAGDWIAESPTALNEFLRVKQEMLSNQLFIDSFTTKGTVFVGGVAADTNHFAGFHMPLLKEWFRKGRGSITFSKSDTVATFRQCDNGGHSAWGAIQRSHYNLEKYSTGVSLLDTLELPNQWQAVIIQCNGCGR